MCRLILRAFALGFLCFVLALGLVGCGGGGASTFALTFSTDWTNFANSGGGQSEQIRVLNTQDTLIASFVMNEDVVGVMSHQFTALQSGTYHLQVLLYSARDLGGVQTGQIDGFVSFNGDTTFQSAVGDTPTSCVVSPSAVTITVQQSQQLYAQVRNASGVTTFSNASDFTWTALGGNTSVSSSGVILGLSAGSGSVRATYTPLTLLGSATTTVTPYTATTTKWTIMVFLNAANDLDVYSPVNFNQMEKAAFNSQVRIVVQWKQAVIPGESANPSFVGTRRYLVKYDTDMANINSQLVQDMGTGVDMGSPQTMLDFINWTKTYYPAQRYAIIVWNHGNGWQSGKARQPAARWRGVSYDDDTGNHIDTWQLAQALGSNTFDILAWDASLMQMAEVATELQGQVHYVAGSEESPPGAGYPYDTILSVFAQSPDASSATLSKAFVDGMINDTNYASNKITQSVIDTTKIPALETAVSAFGDAMVANSASMTSIIPAVRSAAQHYETDTRYYYDLYDICSRTEAAPGVPSAVATASAAVRTAISNAVIYEGHNVYSPGSHGIAIDYSPSSFFTTVATDYGKLRWANETTWDTFLNQDP